jgi:hypothetical protein
LEQAFMSLTGGAVEYQAELFGQPADVPIEEAA